MRCRRPFFYSVIALVMLSIIGCGEHESLLNDVGDAVGDEDETNSSSFRRECLDPSWRFDGDAEHPLTLGTRDDARVFTSYEPSGLADFSWGFQGGAMIEPVIVIDGHLAEGDEVCLFVELRNTPDPDHPDATGDLEDFERYDAPIFFVRRDDGQLHSDPILDQIGYSNPAGVRMILQATVRGEDFAASHWLPLKIVDPD